MAWLRMRQRHSHTRVTGQKSDGTGCVTMPIAFPYREKLMRCTADAALLLRVRPHDRKWVECPGTVV